MSGNRKLPFGYKMELGKIVIHPMEAMVVQEIFEKYILGASYNELVDGLRKDGISYNEGKIWNKSMVARILENKKYVGQSGCPPIITKEQYSRAEEKRSSKANAPQKTEAQKVLRQLSNGSITDLAEQQIRNVLNRLITDPSQIHMPPGTISDAGRSEELRLAWERELRQQPVDEEAAKRLAVEIAAAQYDAVGNQEYESERLRRMFQKQKPMGELDADLLRSAVAAIKISGNRLRICLKNGQVIERGTVT